ncbi:protease [Longibacter salinarum]|uniref:Protease n=1 Tax=Longibacter salinarum TaxID=1850348 RepID=A0A2A8CYC6_9BACT|nr:Do family serine endopeptidase [Longibacter salinarum]PEN13739.1 protease [Longibacter salinarum]
MHDSRRVHFVLGGIGLILIGLFAGVLLMLMREESPPREQVTRVVDRVELGSSQPPLSPASSDAELASEMPQPSALNRLFRDAAERVTPAVVFIEVATEASEDGYHRYDGEMRDFFRNPAPQQSVGSGVIVSESGYVVTNQHVVRRAKEIEVTLADKRQFGASVIGTDASTDLAVLKLEAETTFPALPLGDSDQVEVGDWVVAVGNPFRLTSTVTAGIVSALGRQVNIIDSDFRIEDFIQTDAAINPGNSGGALVNLQGQLVGINTAIATESGSYEGYGFAVPSNLMNRVVKDLIAYGEVRRGFMGVSIEGITARRAQEIGLDSIRGVFVSAVRSDGAADRAGMQKGDVVLKIQSQAVDAPNELQSAVARQRPGDRIDVTVWRNGSIDEYTVQLLGRDDPAYRDWITELDSQSVDPPPSSPSPDRPLPDVPELEQVSDWAIGVRAVQPGEAHVFGARSGVYVAYVDRDGLAAKAGLPRNTIITHVNDAPVDDPEALRRIVQELRSPAVVRVLRRGGVSAFYEIP